MVRRPSAITGDFSPKYEKEFSDRANTNTIRGKINSNILNKIKPNIELLNSIIKNVLILNINIIVL